MARQVRRAGPPCACGCGRSCWQSRNRYATPQCIPSGDRSAWGRRSRLGSLYRFRAQRFKADVQQLTQDGRKLTTEDLVAVFARVYKRGYAAGLRVGLKHAHERTVMREIPTP